MGREELLLAASIKETIREARIAESNMHSIIQSMAHRNFYGPDDEKDAAEAVLGYYTEKVFRDTSILAERLGLPLFRQEISEKRRAFTDLSCLSQAPGDGEMYCKPLAVAIGGFESLSIMTDGNAVTGLDTFRTILENTAKIIDDAHIEPRNEAEVRKEIFRILSHAFRDAAREIPVAKLFKTYRPDLGVRSLMAAAEYKFADTKDEVKKSLDEIYSDMKGYGSNDEWRTFFAVIYMTGPFYHQKDVDEEFRLVRADANWTPIVLNGAGGRIPRQKKATK